MNICIFGASSDRIHPDYARAAQKLGRLIAEGGHRLVFGGGREGLMGACARGALQGGGRPLGIAPAFFDEPGILMKEGCDLILTDTMAQRKSRMEAEADAFIALPGGIGTYEELFEVMTLRQLGRHRMPIALLNTRGYYDPLARLLEETSEKGFMSSSVLSLYALCTEPADALAHVCSAVPPASAGPSLSSYSR